MNLTSQTFKASWIWPLSHLLTFNWPKQVICLILTMKWGSVPYSLWVWVGAVGSEIENNNPLGYYYSSVFPFFTVHKTMVGLTIVGILVLV